MAESQKAASSSVKSKDNTSMLDMDIGKDFLSSWKSISAADDVMDFDFGSPAKGKKKTFNFDKADLDFNLDGDFDKLSSFKIDMSDLDISSPLKKTDKSKERSKEAPAGRNHRGTADSFSFQFDFNEFDTLSFEPRAKNGVEKSDKINNKEGSLNMSENASSGADPAEDTDAMEDDLASKFPVSGDVAASKVETQTSNVKDPGNQNESGTVEDHNPPRRSSIFGQKNLIWKEKTSPEKVTSARIQETPEIDNVSTQDTVSEPCVEEVPQDFSCQSVADNVPAQGSASDIKDVNALARKLSSSKNGERSPDTVRKVASGSVNEGSPSKEFPSSNLMTSQRRSAERGDSAENTNFHSNMGGHRPTENLLQFERTSVTGGSMKLLHGSTAEKHQSLKPEALVAPLNSITKNDEVVPEKDKEKGVIRSKFFKRPNEADSLPQEASRSKLISIASKRISSVQNIPSEEKRLTGISRQEPKDLTRAKTVQTENLEKVKAVNTTQDCINAGRIETGSTSLAASSTHDQGVTKEKLVSRESQRNPESRTALSSRVQPSSSKEQAIKSASPDCSSPKLQETRESVENINVLEENESLKTAGSLKPLNSLVKKDLKSLGNNEQHVKLQGNAGFPRALPASATKQTPPTPTLKRKSFEGSNNADMMALKPLKRLSVSPSDNRSNRASEKVDKQACNHQSIADDNTWHAPSHCQIPTDDAPHGKIMADVETSFSIEGDCNVEKAEACSKELENICIMLKKKHEEAKEILVRAIVNNNYLLMLNHPIYLEKILMVQKFGDSLMCRDYRT